MSDDELAMFIYAELDKQDDDGGGWLGEYDNGGVVIDGYFDLLAIARAIREKIYGRKWMEKMDADKGIR